MGADMSGTFSITAGAALGAAICLQCYLVSATLAEGPAVSVPNGRIELGLGGGNDGAGGRLGGSSASARCWATNPSASGPNTN